MKEIREVCKDDERGKDNRNGEKAVRGKKDTKMIRWREREG